MANEVKVVVNADTKKAEGKLQSFRKSAKKVGLSLGVMGAAGTLAIKSFVGAALEQERALKTLGASVENTGVSFDSVRARIESTTSAIQKKTNFGDEQQIRALQIMVPILGDVDKAMQALPAVLDAASASGKSLETVSNTLTRALSGSVNTATSVGMVFDKDADFAERLALVLGGVGGAAEANVDPMIQMNNALGDVKESIGAALLPIILPLIERVTALAEAAQTMNPRILQIGAGLLAAATAVGILSGAITLLMGASGIGLIVLALGALFVAWQTNFGGIRDITASAINFMREKFGGFFKKIAEWINTAIDGFNFLFRTNIPHIEVMIDKVQDMATAAKDAAKEFVFPKAKRDLIASGIHIDQNKQKMKEFKEETDKATESVNQQHEATKAMMELVSGGKREATVTDIFDPETMLGASQKVFTQAGSPDRAIAGLNQLSGQQFSALGQQVLVSLDINISGSTVFDSAGTKIVADAHNTSGDF